MRGKVCIIQPIVINRRITPAYAGKRDFSAKTPLHDLGSPPPMRGKGIEAAETVFEG